MEEKIKKISLDGWTLFSERHHSNNYLSSDGKYILKTTFDKNNHLDEFRSAINISNGISKLGIPTPRTLEIVEVNNTYGIISEFIKDKKSLSRAISEDFDNMDNYMKIFSDMTKLLHGTKCDKSICPSIKDRVEFALKKYDIFNEKEQKAIRNLLNSLPDTETCLHVDWQMSNVITSPQGNYLIDINLFSYGNPLYDIAILYSFLGYDTIGPEDAAKDIFHFGKDKTNKCWLSFLKHHYNMTNENEIKQFEKKLTPIGVVTFIAHSPYVTICREELRRWKITSFEDAFKEYLT